LLRAIALARASKLVSPAVSSQIVSESRCHLIVGGTLMYYTKILKKECRYLAQFHYNYTFDPAIMLSYTPHWLSRVAQMAQTDKVLLLQPGKHAKSRQAKLA